MSLVGFRPTWADVCMPCNVCRAHDLPERRVYAMCVGLALNAFYRARYSKQNHDSS